MEKILSYSPWNDWVIIMTEDWKVQHIEKEKIAEAFEAYGGSFTKALWLALYRADSLNTLKILTTWELETKGYIEKFL